MKLLILGKLFSNKPQDMAIYQKVLGIQDGFNQLDIETHLLTLTSDQLQLNNLPLKSLKHKPTNWYFINHYFEDILKSISFVEYDAVWVRHHFYGPSILKFITEIKKSNSEIKVFYELPTYPFIHELKGIKKIYASYVEGIYKNNFHKIVDRIITYSNHKKIYNTKTIQISNGINTSLYKRPEIKPINNDINLLAIGKLWNWFGLDRLLKGLIKYKGNHHITIDIFGEGAEMLNLKVFCKKNNLENLVTFHGWRNKDQIDQIISQADIGVGTLAIHRKKVALSSSLKHREYTARGLPFFYSGSDKDFESCEFTYNLYENEEAIDLEEVIRWWTQVKMTPADIASFAQQKLDWKVQLVDVANYLTT